MACVIRTSTTAVSPLFQERTANLRSKITILQEQMQKCMDNLKVCRENLAPLSGNGSPPLSIIASYLDATEINFLLCIPEVWEMIFPREMHRLNPIIALREYHNNSVENLYKRLSEDNVLPVKDLQQIAITNFKSDLRVKRVNEKLNKVEPILALTLSASLLSVSLNSAPFLPTSPNGGAGGFDPFGGL